MTVYMWFVISNQQTLIFVLSQRYSESFELFLGGSVS